MNLRLASGQKVSFIIYNGGSQFEAEETNGYLMYHRDAGIPVLLNNSELNILITDVEFVRISQAISFNDLYRVSVKGVLL